MSLVRLRRTRPRHAVEPAWKTSGRRISRRALLIVGVSLTAGPLAYLLLPVPSAAEPGMAHHVAVAVASPVRTPALVGGLLQSDDLITDPIGVRIGTPDPSPDGPLIGWPVSDRTPSTGFGYRSDPFTHRQRWHDGVDLGQACGDPAWASLDGTVSYAGWAGGYGNRVVLRHEPRNGRSFETTYNHLAKIEVRVGQTVQRGFVVGRVGSTGRSTACHMHFEVILGGFYVDPMRFLTGDQSKASLSRRVGSYMPEGMPSPEPTETGTTTRSPSPSVTRTPSPGQTPTPTTPTPTPTTPGPSDPTSPTTPSPTTPSPTSPSPTAPEPTTPTPSASTAGLSGTPSPAPASSQASAATPGAGDSRTPAQSASSGDTATAATPAGAHPSTSQGATPS